MNITKKYHYLLLLFFCCLFAKDENIYGKTYITGGDGIIRMNINIIGNVKSPGNYIVYDDIDILSALAFSGGYLQGSDLKNIIIYKQDGTNRKINLNKLLNYNKSNNSIVKLEPNDTIVVNQKTISRIFLSSNLPAILLSLINVIITLENTQ